MNNPNEVRCERGRLVIDDFLDSYCAGNTTCNLPHREWDAIKQTVESDAKRIAELDAHNRELIEEAAAAANIIRDLEGCVAALRDALVKCRDGFANSPRSLGYEYTHLPLIDAALNRPGEASSASDTPMAGKEKVG